VSPDLSPWTGPARALAERIVAFIDRSVAGRPTEPFDALALDLHAYQVARCPVRARLVDGPVGSVRDIPAIPVGLFKDLPVGTVAEPEAGATFLTSGTTGGGRGAHRMRSAALYDHGALAWARRSLPRWPERTVNLLVDPAVDPTSSLSHMVAGFAARSTWHQGRDGLDLKAFRAALGADSAFIGATAFAIAELLAADPRPLPLGCTLMVTGGFKGRAVALSDQALFAEAAARLRPEHLVTEYGMTELSSQLWGTPGAPYRPPPWLRALAIDPITAEPAAAGEPGQLRFVDLCNLDGSVAIETLDQGVVSEDGAVHLIGRLPDAPARGCSLTLEEAWAARRSEP
jgi:hypothetical protein